MMMLALVGLTNITFAQDANYPTMKHRYVTNRFGANWFVNAGGDLNLFSSSQEGCFSLNSDHMNAGFDLSVGKWATPGFGMRLKMDGIHYNQVNDGSKHDKLAYTLQLQPMFNLVNLIGGYQPRVYELSLYGGVGMTHNTDDKVVGMVAGAGLFNQFNVTKRFHINLDLFANVGESGVDGNAMHAADKTRMFRTHDWRFGASLGVGVNLGKVGWKPAPDIDAVMALTQSQIDALNASLAETEAENARLKALVASHQCPAAERVTLTDYATASASVFFNVNKTKIANKKDLVSVRELVLLAKDKGAKLVVTGYADSKTGSAARNQALSEGRAEAVVKQLVKMGFDRSNIEVVAKGGVDDLNPYNYNRRATVTIK